MLSDSRSERREEMRRIGGGWRERLGVAFLLTTLLPRGRIGE
jgi:hypothetical protein